MSNRITSGFAVGALGLLMCAGSAHAIGKDLKKLHPGGEEERLLGKGDSMDVRFGNFPSSNITFLGQVTVAEFGTGSDDANDCWGYVTPMGKEIAIIGLQLGTGFVDITDPMNPVIIGAFASPRSLWRDIKIIGTTAYVVTEGASATDTLPAAPGNHIQMFDLADADNGNIGNLGFATFGGSGSTHNIVVNEDSGYIYRVGGGSDLGLRAYGVGVNGAPGSATNPSQQGVQSNLYVHDAQVVTYDSGPYAGREIAFLCSGFGNGFSDTRLRIYDVTDKSNMFELDNVSYPNRRYCHQGWLSEDKKYFYMNDELDEGDTVSTTTMHIFNVEDPANAFYVGPWTNGNTSRDHNLYVKGDYVYASNYRSGLRIHDISDPENPVEVAWIDTYPANDGTGYDGAWSNYPFFPSGNVIISDIQQGLVIVRPELNVLSISLDAALGTTVDPAGGDIINVNLEARGQKIPQSGSGMFHYNLGQGWVVVAMNEIATNRYEATFPAVICGETIDYYFSGSDTTGIVYNDPSGAPGEFFTVVSGASTITQTILDEGLEQGLPSGWSMDGLWNITTNCAAGTSCNGGAYAYFGNTATCTYNTGARAVGSLNVAQMALPTVPVGGALTLEFCYNLQTESNPLFDKATVHVNGTEVELLTASATWTTHTIDLAAYAGQSVVIEFRFDTTDGFSNNFRGFQVDGIKVTAEVIDCSTCYADCDQSTGPGVLDVFDFLCFQNSFVAGNPYACDCDTSTGPGVCDVFDFLCFQNAFVAGCP